MTAPSLTLRLLQNEETGIDISVPTFQEEEAPLGGTSVLYEIAVLTKLDLFKTRLHKDEDVVQFSVYKAYREVEDLFCKLNKKYPNAELPSVPRTSSIDKLSSEEKVAALDKFMKALAKNAELCRSSIFSHFIGIDSQKFSTSSISHVNTISKTNSITSSTAAETKQQSEDDEDLSHVFPKVKNVALKAENKVSQSGLIRARDVDLFEEVKLVKDTKTVSDVKSSNAGSLFDDFDDESLFSSTPAPKPVSSTEQIKAPEVKPRKKEPEKKIVEEVDDSQIIIKDRKLGDISLFKEQDLGDYITQDEEALFLVSTHVDEKSKKNTLLFSNEDSESAEPDSDLHEDLDDLLNLNPLPTSPTAAKKPESSRVSANEVKSKSEINVIAESEQQPKRPVPLPRKKSLGKCDTDEMSIKARPEVMPRKVFLTKPEVSAKPISSVQEVSKPAKPPPVSAKPARPLPVSAKPARPLPVSEKPAKPLPVSEKPALPQKPKPPAKAPKPSQQKESKDLDIVNANQPSALENKTSISSFAEDLNKLDILKYIEQEQKTLESEPSLFD